MIRSCLILLTASLLLVGCNRPSYINVPNDGSDAAINGPNWDTTKRIQKAALAYLLSDSNLPGDVVIRFPQGTTETTAFEIADALAAYNVFPESSTPSDEYHVVEVRKIQARGARGRVDVIRPGELRERELVEVHMELTVWDGWVPEYLRVRNIDVDRVDPLLLAAPAAEPKDEPAYEEVDPVDDAGEEVEEGVDTTGEAAGQPAE
ncbi:MAG: hypothetical protein KTR15_02275 [Phycisphaeraceae bacterium]|nr:hypothetical protein [Phycisphaeraceae bacterium]